MITFQINDEPVIPQGKVSHQVPVLLQNAATESGWNKHKHAKLVEETKKKFPVGSWVLYENTTLSPNYPWAHEVTGFEELWKECKWSTYKNSPECMYLLRVAKANEPRGSSFSSSPVNFRMVTDAERTLIENYTGMKMKEQEPEKESNWPYMTKAAVLDRQIKRFRGVVGDQVSIKGTQRRGTVQDLYSDPKNIEWRFGGTQPVFISVEFSGGIRETFPFKQVKVLK